MLVALRTDESTGNGFSTCSLDFWPNNIITCPKKSPSPISPLAYDLCVKKFRLDHIHCSNKRCSRVRDVGGTGRAEVALIWRLHGAISLLIATASLVNSADSQPFMRLVMNVPARHVACALHGRLFLVDRRRRCAVAEQMLLWHLLARLAPLQA